MSRIELLDPESAPLTARAYFAEGDPGPIVRGLASVPELLAPTLSFLSAALGDGAADPRHKEIAILRTSALQGCRYCVAAHTSVALELGLTADEIAAIRGSRAPDEVFGDPAELALLRWIDAMAGATGPVPDEVFEAARSALSAHVLIELSVTIGATMLLNRFATGFELPEPLDALEYQAAGVR